MGNTQNSELIESAIEGLRAMEDSPSITDQRQLLAGVAAVVDDLAKQLRDERSGKAAILEALTDAYPAPVSASVLRTLSGIQEFARRVRELRVESGYEIVHEDDGYRLVSTDPDNEAAKRWATLNEVRRRPGASMDRLRALFVENVGVVFKSTEIIYVGRVSSAPRRLRQLRIEEGYRIESHKDNPDLRFDEYLLVDPEPIPHVERRVPLSLRSEVLDRDNHACAVCGRGPDRDNRIWLEVDHIVPIENKGTNDLENLRAICNLCHPGRS